MSAGFGPDPVGHQLMPVWNYIEHHLVLKRDQFWASAYSGTRQGGVSAGSGLELGLVGQLQDLVFRNDNKKLNLLLLRSRFCSLLYIRKTQLCSVDVDPDVLES